MDERAAVERLKGGDIGGLEWLVRRHHTRAVRAAYLIVRERTLAEDVVQSAFVRAYERIGQFDLGGSCSRCPTNSRCPSQNTPSV